MAAKVTRLQKMSSAEIFDEIRTIPTQSEAPELSTDSLNHTCSRGLWFGEFRLRLRGTLMIKLTQSENLKPSTEDSGSIDAVERIKAAIRALPCKLGVANAAAFDNARNAVQAALIFGPMNDAPRAQDASCKQTLSELRSVHDLLFKLVTQIQKMHSPALRAVASQHPLRKNPLSFERELIDLGCATLRARNLPFAELPQKKGRNHKNGALQIALAMKSVYESYTGRRATLSSAFSTGPKHYRPSGEFFQFLKAVFEIGNIDADPHTFARKVTRDHSQRVSRGT
jgi:hypothetical protein